MKLRNKKTGNIIDSNEWTIESGYLYVTISNDNDSTISYKYESLAELNKEWEDYIPKEPLIRDENTREAVRAWAKVNSIGKVMYTDGLGRSSCILTDMGDNDYDIGFVGWIPTLEDGEVYTILELCEGDKDEA